MAIDQLDAFMKAIGQQESGGNYEAKGPYTGSTYGHAQGKYQIMEKIWPGWAAEAGIPGADPWDPAAQEHVARFKMTQYYNRYGSWPLVAIAWFAGPGRANTAAKHGIDAVGGISDVLGTDVRTYVETMLSGMGRTSAIDARRVQRPGGRTISDPPGADVVTHIGPSAEPLDPATRRENFEQDQAELGQDAMVSILDSLSSKTTADGGRVHDIRAMFGDIFSASDDANETDEVA